MQQFNFIIAAHPLTQLHNKIWVHLPAGDIYHEQLGDEEAQIW